MNSISMRCKKLWHDLIAGRISYEDYKSKISLLEDKQLSFNFKEVSHEQKSSKNSRR